MLVRAPLSSVVFFVLAFGAVGCSAASIPPAATPAVAVDPDTLHGRLRLTGVAQRMANDSLHLDITVANPFEEPVKGLRVLYRILLSQDEKAAEVARTQSVFDHEIAAGGEATVTITLPPQAAQRGFGTFLHVYAVERGGTPLPAPPDWDTEAP